MFKWISPEDLKLGKFLTVFLFTLITIGLSTAFTFELLNLSSEDNFENQLIAMVIFLISLVFAVVIASGIFYGFHITHLITTTGFIILLCVYILFLKTINKRGTCQQEKR